MRCMLKSFGSVARQTTVLVRNKQQRKQPGATIVRAKTENKDKEGQFIKNGGR